jgi:hypothetical protein
MSNIKLPRITGAHGPYFWLSTGHHDLSTLMARCPQTIIGKYIAVTSQDSGALVLNDEEKNAGWQSRKTIAYSPQVQSVEKLHYGECGGFDEWYVSESRLDLGQLGHDNVFEFAMVPGQVWTFVNYFHFTLHDPENRDPLVTLFWKQLDWIQPESYIADGACTLTFVSRNQQLFTEVYKALDDEAEAT